MCPTSKLSSVALSSASRLFVKQITAIRSSSFPRAAPLGQYQLNSGLPCRRTMSSHQQEQRQQVSSPPPKQDVPQGLKSRPFLKKMNPATRTDSNKNNDGGREHFYDGQVVSYHLENLDDMIAKTHELQQKMEELKARKQHAHASKVERVSAKDLDELLEDAIYHKALLTTQFEEFRAKMDGAKYKLVLYAVDGPEGEDDEHYIEELEEIEHIIEYAASHEDREHVIHQHEEHDKLQSIVARQPIV